MPLLDVQHLRKQFSIHHLERTVEAFGDVSFRLDAGEFVLVRGANGVGKSTLLRCLYRTYVPSGGSAIFASSGGAIDLVSAPDVDMLALRRHDIGHVTQFLRPRPRVRAIDLVVEPLLEAGADLPAAREEAESWLNAFGLKSAIHHAYPSTFSGGEQQKVNLVHALIAPRRLLLLDEPTASLDAAARAALLERLTELRKNGVAMIGVFHHPEDVRPIIDKEIYLQTP